MANNFSNDPNCVSLWRMESGALTVDSIGMNTLTDNNTVGTDTVNFKEGAASALFAVANLESLSRTDANLSAGFPLKNGDTAKVISICAWFRFASYTADRTIFAKHDSYTPGQRSFRLMIGTDAKACLTLGFNGGVSDEDHIHASVLSVNTWYHVTATYNNADKSYAIRIRDTNGNIVGADLSDIATLDANKLYAGTGGMGIGAQFYYSICNDKCFDGQIDEVVPFKDIITADEATAIAKGLYGYGQSPTGGKFPTLGETVSESPWSDNTWVTPTNIYSDDGNTASVTATTFDLNDQTYVLKATGFDFSSIPDTATITGVICRANAWGDGDSSVDLMQLLNASKEKVGTNQCLTPVALPTDTGNIVTKGSSSDLWGNELTPAWVKDADFGVALGAIATANNAQVLVDYVTLEIFYTVGGTAGGKLFFLHG